MCMQAVGFGEEWNYGHVGPLGQQGDEGIGICIQLFTSKEASSDNVGKEMEEWQFMDTERGCYLVDSTEKK